MKAKCPKCKNKTELVWEDCPNCGNNLQSTWNGVIKKTKDSAISLIIIGGFGIFIGGFMIDILCLGVSAVLIVIGVADYGRTNEILKQKSKIDIEKSKW